LQFITDIQVLQPQSIKVKKGYSAKQKKELPPFPISPKGEMIKLSKLLPPWGKVGLGV
jgi:hypothetical protein